MEIGRRIALIRSSELATNLVEFAINREDPQAKRSEVKSVKRPLAPRRVKSPENSRALRSLPNVNIMISRRSAVLAAIVFLVILAIYRESDLISGASSVSKSSILLGNATTESSKAGGTAAKGSANSPLSPGALNYFDQVFSVDKPATYDFPALRQQCEHTNWQGDDVYLECGAMAAGLTSIMSQVKTCFKMAIEAGAGIVLPSMPLRDSKDLNDFNFFNDAAHHTYEKWFDVDHMTQHFTKACPRMRIIHPDQVNKTMTPVKFKWNIKIGSAPGYKQFEGYFWTGRPFRSFFDQKYKEMQQNAFFDPKTDHDKKGMTVITIDAAFTLFRVTDDPTGHDRELWNDLGYLIRFKEEPRKIIHQVLSQMNNRPFYGVHFRVENDTIWSSLDTQLTRDLDALDSAWTKYGKKGAQKPLVYLACGDEEKIEKFVEAGKLRGWEVTHKWALAQGNVELTKMINELPFDFQGAVDMGPMILSHFFLGFTGSAFSSTIANARDVTGRYRGSSFSIWDDGNARTYLFNDGDSKSYPCCL